MSETSSLLTITLATTKSERAEALHFIQEAMRAHFKCIPPKTVGAICTARIGNEICGSFAIAGTQNETPFPIESHYEFNSEHTPFELQRSNYVQGTRWNCTRNDLPYISLRLLYFAFSMAFELGKKYMLIEAKPGTIRYLKTIGIKCHPIKDAVLLVEQVKATLGEEGMKYFIEPPLPTLYILELEPSIMSLSTRA